VRGEAGALAVVWLPEYSVQIKLGMNFFDTTARNIFDTNVRV
jgi:hypothetical protein